MTAKMRPFTPQPVPALLFTLLLGATTGFAPQAIAQEVGQAAAQNATQNAVTLTMAEIEAAYAAGDLVTARAGLQQLATAGDAASTPSALALYRYGRILLDPRSGPRDVLGAVTVLEQAVMQRHLQAHTLLARLYLIGEEGVAQDLPRAADLLQFAATRGQAEAQFYLGQLLLTRSAADDGKARGLSWLEAAADQQFGRAAFLLAQSYSNEKHLPQDRVKAMHWLHRAADMGHGEAQLQLAHSYERGREVTQDKAEALRWYRAAAETGHPVAQRVLGAKYLAGDGVTQDNKAALLWLERAAARKEPGALHNLGLIYAEGRGVPRDDSRALAYFRAGDAHSVTLSTYQLARFHEEGRATAVDLDQAVDLYRKLAENGLDKAALALGRLAGAGQLDGRVAPHRAVPWAVAALNAGDMAALTWLEQQAAARVRPAETALALHLLATDPTRISEAAALLERAARADDPRAQEELGQLYSSGIGVTQDYVTAHKWMNLAAALGRRGAAETREVLSLLMTPEQIAEAQDAARQHLATPQGPQN